MFTQKRITLIGILLVLVIGGTYSYFRLIVGKRLTPQASAKLVPERASSLTFIDTDPDIWSQLEKYGTPEAQAVWKNHLEQLEQDILPHSELNYEEDIAPWLSGMAIAHFPSFNPFSQDKNVLVIAGITNSLKARNFLNSLNNHGSAEAKQRQYQGVTITEIETADGDRVSGAMVQGYVLFSPRGRIIEQAIATAQGQPSFGSEEGMQQLLSRGLNLENSAAQIYLTDHSQWLGKGLAGQGFDVIESAVMGIELKPEGIHWQTLALSAETEFLTLPPNESQLLSEVPESTVALINGHQLDQLWSQLVDRTQETPLLRVGLSVMRRWARSWDLDLDQDVFSWLDGEYAIALFPTQESSLPNLPLAGGILIESSQREVGEQTLAKLTKIAAKNPFLTQETERLGNTEVTIWQDPSQQPLLNYGWLQKERLMITVATPLRIFAEKQGDNSLRNSPQFKAMAAHLPDSNFGYVYLNIKQAMTFLEAMPQHPLKKLSPEAKATLNSLEQVALTAFQPEPSWRQIDLFLTLTSTTDDRN